jgi:hypothetical protein
MEHIRRFISPPHKMKGETCITRVSLRQAMEMFPLLRARSLSPTSKRWSVAANIRLSDTKFFRISLSNTASRLSTAWAQALRHYGVELDR